MKFFDQIGKMSHFCYLIKTKATGCPKQFASKVGLSERQVYRVIEELRELGIRITFCKDRNSYYFENEAFVSFKMTVVENGQERKIIGGGNNFKNYEDFFLTDMKWQWQTPPL